MTNYNTTWIKVSAVLSSKPMAVEASKAMPIQIYFDRQGLAGDRMISMYLPEKIEAKRLVRAATRWSVERVAVQPTDRSQ